jgi:hypothetical protein
MPLTPALSPSDGARERAWRGLIPHSGTATRFTEIKIKSRIKIKKEKLPPFGLR